MLRAVLAWCAAVGCAPEPPPDLPVEPPPLPGPELLRVAPSRAVVGQRFSFAEPLVFELHLPRDVRVEGRGLPPDLEDPAPLAAGYPRALDRSVIQLEVPVRPLGQTDEDGVSVVSFDRPVFCRVGAPCIWPDDADGRWRAWRIRAEAGGTTVTELQLGGVGEDANLAGRPLLQVVGVWLDEAAAPLDGSDRVRFAFVGNVPGLATEWLDDPLRPRLRFADRCPTAPCWRTLEPDEVQGLALSPGLPAFVRVIAPLDAELGATTPLRMVVSDAWGNPSPTSGVFQATWDGAPLGPPLTADQEWSLAASVSLPVEGLGLLGVQVPSDSSATAVGQPVRVWAPGAAPWVRRVGDTHIHSGDARLPRAFSPTNRTGDHAAGFTRGAYALRYLDEVAGTDFGALSEHAARYEGWTPPGPGFEAFGPGGACAVGTSTVAVEGDWWAASQRTSAAYDAARPDFVAFPAWEWHGRQARPGDTSPLHRVVLFRDFDLPSHDLPMLPGTAVNVPPQCLIRFLAEAGYGPDDVLAIPHLMELHDGNLEWEHAYARRDADALASPEEVDDYVRLVEVFSARNPPGVSGMLAVEGTGAEPYSIRGGWQLGARVGLIGASDSHSQLPGVDDTPRPGQRRSHLHEPGGLAVALVDPGADPRDGVFDALRSRRTYATTGVRAWMDLAAVVDGEPVPMGTEVEGACAVVLHAEVGAALRVRELVVVGAPVVPGAAFEVLGRAAPDAEVAELGVAAAPDPGATWLYYARALLGPVDPGTPATDAAWTSPVWVRWGACP